MTIFYSPYGTVSSAHFSSTTAELQSVYFASLTSTVDWTRPFLYDYVSWTEQTDGDFEFHAVGVNDETAYPVTYNPHEPLLTSKLTNKHYKPFGTASRASDPATHFISTSVVTDRNGNVAFISASDKIDRYVRTKHENHAVSDNVPFASINRPLKIRGATIEDDNTTVYAVYDTAGTISYVSHSKEIEFSSSSSLSSVEAFSTSSITTSSSTYILTSSSEISMLDCNSWDLTPLRGIKDVSFIDSIEISGVTSRFSDSGNLYLCFYTQFTGGIASMYYPYLLKEPSVKPFLPENIMAVGNAFTPVAPLITITFEQNLIETPGGKVLTGINGQMKLNTGIVPTSSTFSLIKLRCTENLWISSKSSPSSLSSSSISSSSASSMSSLSSGEPSSSQSLCVCDEWYIEGEAGQINYVWFDDVTEAMNSGCLLLMGFYYLPADPVVVNGTTYNAWYQGVNIYSDGAPLDENIIGNGLSEIISTPLSSFTSVTIDITGQITGQIVLYAPGGLSIMTNYAVAICRQTS